MFLLLLVPDLLFSFCDFEHAKRLIPPLCSSWNKPLKVTKPIIQVLSDWIIVYVGQTYCFMQLNLHKLLNTTK